jgi:hypothetical protein
MDFTFSQHALDQMDSRGISKETVENILANPDQILTLDDLTVFQQVVSKENPLFLIRVFVNMRKTPNLVVTVYQTSKISKYYENKI